MRSYESCQIDGALPITRVATATEDAMLNPVPGRRMDMPGFEDRFVDFPDYIFRITDDIWHKRDLEYVSGCYADDCIIHTQTQTGVKTSTRSVINATAATLESFPDRRLDADNVIWSRDPHEDGDYFYSSHRITSKMTNGGPSEFGSMTGRKVRVTTFADTTARNNDIFEEWLVRDYGAMVVQMGLSPEDAALKMARADRDAGLSIHDDHAPNRKGMDVHTARVGTEAERLVVSLLERSWEAPDLYDFRAKGDYPYGRSLYGPDQIAAERQDWLRGLTDIRYRADHICEVPYLGDAVDVALRWSMTAEHSGEGRYGAPTGETLYILGVSHFRILGGVIREEATLWDDVGVMRMVEGIRLGR